MKLYEAIAYAIERDGKDVITRSPLVNYLSDLQAYDTPAVKRIVETFVKDGYGIKLLDNLLSDGYELQANDIVARMVRSNGFQQDLVRYVVSSMSYALGKTDTLIAFPSSESKQSIIQTHEEVRCGIDTSVPINPKEPWTRYQYPSLDLLDDYGNNDKPYMDDYKLNAQKERIINVLRNYGIKTEEIKATVSPKVTFYEITPANGVKMTKVKRVQEDIAQCNNHIVAVQETSQRT